VTDTGNMHKQYWKKYTTQQRQTAIQTNTNSNSGSDAFYDTRQGNEVGLLSYSTAPEITGG